MPVSQLAYTIYPPFLDFYRNINVLCAFIRAVFNSAIGLVQGTRQQDLCRSTVTSRSHWNPIPGQQEFTACVIVGTFHVPRVKGDVVTVQSMHTADFGIFLSSDDTLLDTGSVCCL